MTYGPPVPVPTPQRYDPQPDANRYTALLWSHINLLRQRFGLHHATHEPGGLDVVQIPLGGLVDVALGTAVADGAALVWDAAGTVWVAGAGGGGGHHGVHFGVTCAPSVVPPIAPGPVNLTGVNYTITAVHIAYDGVATGSFSAGNYSASFPPAVDASELTNAWNAGNGMTLTVSGVDEDVTYIAVDVALQE
jgi:hypothetical protein